MIYLLSLIIQVKNLSLITKIEGNIMKITVSLREMIGCTSPSWGVGGFLRVLCARGKITAEQRDALIEDYTISGFNDMPEEILNLADDDEQFPAASIVDPINLKDAIGVFYIRSENSTLWQHYAVWCAQQVRHLLTDERSSSALDVARRHINGEGSAKKIVAAVDAADKASRALDVAADRGSETSINTIVASCAAAVAHEAVCSASKSGLQAAAHAHFAAFNAAYTSALSDFACSGRTYTGVATVNLVLSGGAFADAREIQSKKLIEILNAGEWVD